MRLFLVFMLISTAVCADDDGLFGFKFGDDKNQVKVVNNPLYQQNCGECHFAYQPALLPQSSWQQLMQVTELENHFGDDASVDEADRVAITAYLTANSSKAKSKNSPLRITEQAFFRDEHKEIPAKYVKDNPKVLSFSQCDRCHTKAAEGTFEDDFVTIPNYGRWDD